MRWLRGSLIGGSAPKPPGFSAFFPPEWGSLVCEKGTGWACPPGIPAAEPVARVASQQRPIPSGSGRPIIDLLVRCFHKKAANGNYPLNFVSHIWGSPHRRVGPPACGPCACTLREAAPKQAYPIMFGPGFPLIQPRLIFCAVCAGGDGLGQLPRLLGREELDVLDARGGHENPHFPLGGVMSHLNAVDLAREAGAASIRRHRPRPGAALRSRRGGLLRSRSLGRTLRGKDGAGRPLEGKAQSDRGLDPQRVMRLLDPGRLAYFSHFDPIAPRAHRRGETS